MSRLKARRRDWPMPADRISRRTSFLTLVKRNPRWRPCVLTERQKNDVGRWWSCECGDALLLRSIQAGRLEVILPGASGRHGGPRTGGLSSAVGGSRGGIDIERTRGQMWIKDEAPVAGGIDRMTNRQDLDDAGHDRAEKEREINRRRIMTMGNQTTRGCSR